MNQEAEFGSYGENFLREYIQRAEKDLRELEGADPSEDKELLRIALNGDRGPDQQRIAEIGLDLVATLLRKNNDYGSSAWSNPFLIPYMNPKDGILCRASDKVARIASLALRPAEVKESLRDTIKDLAGYCLLWLGAPDAD